MTRDTNAYIHLGLATDGHTIATVERQIHNKGYDMPNGASSSQAWEFTLEGFPNYELRWMQNGQSDMQQSFLQKVMTDASDR